MISSKTVIITISKEGINPPQSYRACKTCTKRVQLNHFFMDLVFRTILILVFDA
jgi:hypothetical protein